MKGRCALAACNELSAVWCHTFRMRYREQGIELVCVRDKDRQRGCGIAQHDEERSLPGVGQVQRRLEQALGKRRVPDCGEQYVTDARQPEKKKKKKKKKKSVGCRTSGNPATRTDPRDAKRLASLCVGGGMGVAIAIGTLTPIEPRRQNPYDP